MNQVDLLQKAYKKVEDNKENIQLDPYRLHFHLMPPTGLLNDPNGLIHYKGTYHVFYQWNPFQTAHGSKFWGHYTSRDLIHWQEQQPALVPNEWYEKDGCYSGSAIEANGELVLFYTGNVKHGEDKRETYQCMAVSSDGLKFEKKGPVLFLPEEYTSHFRDPKVWKREDVWYAVVGAQNLNKEGVVALFSSTNLKEWNHIGILAGSKLNGLTDLGYMWECPDFFKLGEKDVLLVSPQGVEAKGHLYQNEFQSGYFIGKWKVGTTEYLHGEFTELDRGFDFYAPQTFEDERGRRIMIGWMGITDEQEVYQPTIEKGWVHALTIPRELVLEGEKLIQKPVTELKQLRQEDGIKYNVKLENEEKSWEKLAGVVSELKIRFEHLEAETIELNIRSHLKLTYNQDQNLFTLQRKRFKDGKVESRSCELPKLEELYIYLDTSSVEIFINGGSEVFTARFFADPKDEEFAVNVKGQVHLFIEKWNLVSR
ncbi:beta-fructofuranosidase [Evansella vedderi]|uniref:Sucrose-6-phosphate hydrolase n=1 Tax=Evansella vedderi TaxID=38282 RepID=A0ABT9ZQI7_9BACI|nr:sucrose-6-phosphate hydrolase [Evansella vedderi]MDQ0253507.1 beta-fructofuranosidase [Evansella vedderi]